MRYWPFLLLLLLFAACTKEPPAPPLSPDPTVGNDTLVSPSTYTYLALGDSYTIGASVPEADRYPLQLATELVDLGAILDPVDIVARTGWTTDELNQGINQRTDLRETYDLVSLLIGVNNQYRGYSIDQFALDFAALLNRAILFAGGRAERVFVLSIPDYAYTPFGGGDMDISEEIDAFNAVNAQITMDRGVRYFDITPISRRGLDQPDLVAGDGLHPSGKQYGLWVQQMLLTVRGMLDE